MLNKQEIAALIREEKLVEGYIDLDIQLTPNGFDLTADAVYEFSGIGSLDFSNKQRIIPQTQELQPVKDSSEDKFGWWHLKKGAYKVKTNETLNLPPDLVGLGFSRTSLLRMGAFTQNGAWDAGFRGKSEFILVVENPQGMRLKQNARVVQLVFLRINEVQDGYNGIYQDLK